MHHNLGRILRFPLYLWILGIYPILHLYSVNFGLVMDHEVAPTIAAMLVATSIVFVLAGRVLPNQHKRAFYLGIGSLFFSMSGHVYSMIFMPRSLLVWNLATAVIVILASVAFNKCLSQRVYAQITASFNLTTAALLGAQIIILLSNMGSAQEYARTSSAYGRTTAAEPAFAKVEDSATHPDVYYIIPDAYPSDEWLASAMNYDNSDFTKALEDRGFVVTGHAQSNYASTLMSLASILNMRYFSSNQSEFNNLDFLRLSIATSDVARQLQQLGYTYVQFVSGYLYPSPIADINRDFGAGGPIEITMEGTIVSAKALQDRRSQEILIGTIAFPFTQPFTSLYVDTTGLRIVRSQLEKIRLAFGMTPYNRTAPERFLATIDEIESIVLMPEATFTIAHLLKPHGPVNFNESGGIIEQIPNPSPAEFLADFRFANSQFLRAIDTILRGSVNQPVIIFQADHGTRYGEIVGRKLARFDTYAAYYLPNSFAIDVPETYTLINSFPLILNEIFGTDYRMHEDHLFELPAGYSALSEQTNVTEISLHH